MNYDDVKVGDRVQIQTKEPKYREIGIVIGKQQQFFSGAPHERVWVDTQRGGRRICVPAILEAVSDEGSTPA